jgi:hypothetical protein
MDVAKEKLQVVRARLDKVPALQQAEVSQRLHASMCSQTSLLQKDTAHSYYRFLQSCIILSHLFYSYCVLAYLYKMKPRI